MWSGNCSGSEQQINGDSKKRQAIGGGADNTGRQLRLDIKPACSLSVDVKMNSFWNILDQTKFLCLEVLDLSKCGVGG